MIDLAHALPVSVVFDRVRRHGRARISSPGGFRGDGWASAARREPAPGHGLRAVGPDQYRSARQGGRRVIEGAAVPNPDWAVAARLEYASRALR